VRDVRLVYTSDEGKEVDFMSEMSDMAIHDMIRFMETADGDEEYEEGDFAGD
jgi:hypothetical protein